MSSDGKEAPAQRRVLRYRRSDGRLHEASDELVLEAPLELVAGEEVLSVVMRTPGHDLELIRGLLHAEGVLRADDSDVLRQVDRDRVELTLAANELEERWHRRSLLSSASCGVCGTTSLALLDQEAGALGSTQQWHAEDIMALPDRLRDAQTLFRSTGGLHGAGLFGAGGELLQCREDIGRHNAVDKLVGWALEQCPETLDSALLCVSGRVSFEIVQKAIAARIPVIVAVSAASSLAVDLAERWRLTLVGFVRESGFNVYSHGARIATD